MVMIRKNGDSLFRQVHFQGITHSTVIDCEEGLFAALLEFAFYHTLNSIQGYENVLMNSKLPEQKMFLLQLILRKKDILKRLARYRSEFYNGHALSRKDASLSTVKKLPQKGLPPLFTLSDSIKFAFQKENRTLSLFKRQRETMQHEATKALFDCMIAAQYDCTIYLATEFALTTSEITAN